MFYEPGKTNHGLPKNPFNSLVIPRPIGWITSVDADGLVNLAPYSFFNAVSYRPPTVMFSASRGATSPNDNHKDSQRNIEVTGEFVCNLTTWDTREAMNATAAGVGMDVDELALAGLTAEASVTVKPPRVAEVPVHLECKHIKTVELPGETPNDVYCVIFGQVVGIHIRDEFITAAGEVDVGKMRPIARLGYQDYAVVNADTIFTMQRPE
jgi:flavin reductase (DIM6/NTAB) family NADH-FMN oxidoreductase RutF